MNKSHKWSEEIRGLETDVEKLKVQLTEIGMALEKTKSDIDASLKVLGSLFDPPAETKK